MSLSAGLNFSHWHDIVNVDAAIQTGEGCVSIVGNPMQKDYGNDWALNTSNIPFNIDANRLVQTDQDRGSCSVSVFNGDLHIVMSNVYPAYANEFSFDYGNCGTVPMQLIDLTFIPENNTAGNYTVAGPSCFQLDLNGDGKNDVEIWWVSATGNTLSPPPAANSTLVNNFYICFLESTPQNATLILDIHANFQDT